MKKWMKSLLFVGVLGFCVFSGKEAFAETIDLNGYTAKITTEGNQNYVSTSKGKWALTEDSQITSSKAQTLYLNNTVPVKIDSLYMKKNLDLRGKGELQLDTEGQFGINVLGNFDVFTCTTYGAGKITSTGNVDGVHVYGSLKLYSGILEGLGQEHGVWSNSSTYVYNQGTLIGTADANNINGIGVWSNKEITACKNSLIHGTGKASGVYTEGNGCKYIYSDLGSTITGTASSMNNRYSAIHAKNGKVKACSQAKLIEEYTYDTSLVWTAGVPFKINAFQAIKNNMNDFKNYSWNVEDGFGTVAVNQNGLISDDLFGVLTGTRTGTKAKGEPVYLPCNGVHIVRISDVMLSIN